MGVPAIIGLLVIVTYPDVRMPWVPCLCLEVLINILAMNRSLGCFTIACGRLFYLFKEVTSGIIQEERFFSTLNWITPTLDVLIVSILVGDNFYRSINHPRMIIYNCCIKNPIPWEEFSESLSFRGGLIFLAVLFTIGLCMQMLIFRKIKLMESRILQNEGIIAYNVNGTDDTIIYLINAHPPRPWTYRRTRTVVSEEGCFLTFLVISSIYLFMTYHYVILTPSGPPLMFDLIVFIRPCLSFCLCNIIQIFLSPTLFNSLYEIFDVIPWLEVRINVRLIYAILSCAFKKWCTT